LHSDALPGTIAHSRREGDLNELEQIVSGVNDAAHWVAHEFTSIWLPIQLAAIVIAAAIAWLHRPFPGR
jgi:hypothetical protein